MLKLSPPSHLLPCDKYVTDPPLFLLFSPLKTLLPLSSGQDSYGCTFGDRYAVMSQELPKSLNIASFLDHPAGERMMQLMKLEMVNRNTMVIVMNKILSVVERI